MLSDTVITAALGALICLDRIAVQVMISRPIVAAPFIGFALGDIYTGLVVGALLELLWADRIPVGPYVPPHDTFVAILATAGAILAASAPGHPPRELIALSILLFAPAAIAGQKMEGLLRGWNDELVMLALQDAAAGDASGVSRRHLTALGRYFAGSLAFLIVALPCGAWVVRSLYPELPGPILRILVFSYYLMPFIGVGVALNSIKLRGYVPLFCGVFLLLAIVADFL